MRPFFVSVVLLPLVIMLTACQQPAPVAVPPPAAPAARPVQIPKLAEGTDPAGDWAKQAHWVRILNPIDNTPGSKAELALAWTPKALLFRAQVADATPFEDSEELWDCDAVGFHIASSPGSDDSLDIVATPGRTPKHPTPRWRIEDTRGQAPAQVPPQIHADYDAKGYTLTIALPWANFAHVPQPGDIIGMQVCVNDAQGANPLSHRTWFPSLASGIDQQQRVQLAEQADPPEIAMARIWPHGFNTFAVEVLGVPEAAGKNVEVWANGRQVVSGKLAPGGFDGDSQAGLILPPELGAQKDTPLLVTVDGQPLPTVLKIPDLAIYRQTFIEKQPFAASPAIFSGTAFPKVDFVNHELIEAAIGSYTVHPRFFDAQWNEVTAPTAPGRYGAQVEVRFEDGLTCTHEITLFKTPKPYVPSTDPYTVVVKFPEAFGFSAATLASEQWNISDWNNGILKDSAHENPPAANLEAALSDIAANPARLHGFEVDRINSDWWAELERRQGKETDYPRVVRLPDGYDKDPHAAWPLLIYLHGSGERGTDLKLVEKNGPLYYIKTGHPLPCIVVAPQCPQGEWWVPARLNRLIDQVCAANRVDPKRIYVTGLSMGGYGTFDLAGEYPERFAAIAPVAAGGNPAIAERLGKMPTWIFHGTEDTTVPTRYDVDIYHAMQKLGAPVKLTLYPGLGHGGWHLTYDNPELYAWLLKQSK